jgi:hypothetical protein
MTRIAAVASLLKHAAPHHATPQPGRDTPEIGSSAIINAVPYRRVAVQKLNFAIILFIYMSILI